VRGDNASTIPNALRAMMLRMFCLDPVRRYLVWICAAPLPPCFVVVAAAVGEPCAHSFLEFWKKDASADEWHCGSCKAHVVSAAADGAGCVCGKPHVVQPAAVVSAVEAKADAAQQDRRAFGAPCGAQDCQGPGFCESAACSARDDTSAAASWRRGVPGSWLVMFTTAHGCWDWTTQQVRDRIVSPATARHGNCRYVDLPFMRCGQWARADSDGSDADELYGGEPEGCLCGVCGGFGRFRGGGWYASCGTPPPSMLFSVGDGVKLTGLVRATHLNGRTGRVTHVPTDAGGRYTVQVSRHAGTGAQELQARVKGCNLQGCGSGSCSGAESVDDVVVL